MQSTLVALTGASGASYGIELVRQLLAHGRRVTFILSDCGRQVANFELGLEWPAAIEAQRQAVRAHFGTGEELTVTAPDDFFAPAASGSALTGGMVICPCSMGTLGRIAAGVSGNLIERAADVALKERRPLLLVPRETPLSAIHLENMLKLNRAGADILPAMPAFYHHPRSIDDLVRQLVGRILDRLGIDNALAVRWGGDRDPA